MSTVEIPRSRRRPRVAGLLFSVLTASTGAIVSLVKARSESHTQSQMARESAQAQSRAVYEATKLAFKTMQDQQRDLWRALEEQRALNQRLLEKQHSAQQAPLPQIPKPRTVVMPVFERVIEHTSDSGDSWARVEDPCPKEFYPDGCPVKPTK